MEPFPTTPIVSSRDHDAADRLLDNEMQPTPDDPVNTTETYAFDNNGNLVQSSEDGGQTTAYVWDHENRLSQMTEDGGQTTEFVYNGNGDRTARIVDGVTNHYILDAAASLHNVLVETDTNGVPQRYYLFGARGLYAQIESDGSTFYTHADELGSTLALTDDSGSVVRQYAYSPYGEIINQTGSVDTPYTYIGAYGVYREAAQTGLYHMKARYYDAGLKRFLSKDSIGLEGGVNWYLYANGNPVGFVDWWGLCAEVMNSARLSESVYSDFGAPEGFERISNYSDANGFFAAHYRNVAGQNYLAYRGTTPTSLADWSANSRQALGFNSSQYETAVSLARTLNRQLDGNLRLTGHSLGGGLASAASIETGLDAITFNSAGLNSDTVYIGLMTNPEEQIDAYYVRGEILSRVQDWTPLPNAAGARIPLKAYPRGGIIIPGVIGATQRIDLHGMNSVIRSLEAEGY